MGPGYRANRVIFLFLLAAVFQAVSPAEAMTSSNYRLDWFTPLTNGGGGDSLSPNYQSQVTVGQSVLGNSASTSYKACLGYWCGMEGSQVLLPLIFR